MGEVEEGVLTELVRQFLDGCFSKTHNKNPELVERIYSRHGHKLMPGYIL